MEETDEDNTDDTQQATRQVIEGGGNTAVNSIGFHRSPRGHTLKLIQDVVTRWNSTYYMLERCIHLQIPLCKLIDELGLEGPSEADWSAAKMLCQFLKPFQIVTDYLQGEKYPTLGMQFVSQDNTTDVVFTQAKATSVLGIVEQDLG